MLSKYFIEFSVVKLRLFFIFVIVLFEKNSFKVFFQVFSD